MANGNPSFNNPAVFVGSMDEPTTKTGSSRMAREEKKTTMKKKLTVKEFHEMVRGMVKEALVKHVSEAKRMKRLQEMGGTTPPPVPARAMVQGPQKIGGGGQVDINTVLAKRAKGQPLSPDEKRAYLDHVGSQNVTARKQAQQQQAQSSVGQSLNAIEQNPERFTK